VVEETFKYAATPDSAGTAMAAWDAIQTCREVYNHALTQEYRPRSDGDKPSYTEMQNKLTGESGWKKRWSEWQTVYSKCLQMAVRRIKQSESVLNSLQDRGYTVGQLKWKAPREYRSIVYNQSGFDVDDNTDRTTHAIVNFSKIGDFHLNYHRPLPADGNITQIILKKRKPVSGPSASSSTTTRTTRRSHLVKRLTWQTQLESISASRSSSTTQRTGRLLGLMRKLIVTGLSEDIARFPGNNTTPRTGTRRDSRLQGHTTD